MATFEELLAQAYGNVVKAGEAITSPEYMKRFLCQSHRLLLYHLP